MFDYHFDSYDDVIYYLDTEKALLWHGKGQSFPTNSMRSRLLWHLVSWSTEDAKANTWNTELALEQNDACLFQQSDLMKLTRNQRHQKVCFASQAIVSTGAQKKMSFLRHSISQTTQIILKGLVRLWSWPVSGHCIMGYFLFYFCTADSYNRHCTGIYPYLHVFKQNIESLL